MFLKRKKNVNNLSGGNFKKIKLDLSREKVITYLLPITW